MLKNEEWPANCPWPRPLKDGEGDYWDAEDAGLLPVDEEIENLLEIKEYYDGLVDEGILDEDYRLNPDCEEFIPDRDNDYWDNGFDYDFWESDLADHMNLLKLPALENDPVAFIREVTGYEFINENLARQAFTRRAFGTQFDVGDCEKMEFLGDAVLNMVVTREIIRQLTDVAIESPEEPFCGAYDEGELSRIRAHFVCKEYLAECAKKHGLDRLILYGSGEETSESSREDMIEALIGAVAIDSGWSWRELEEVVDRLLCVQLTRPDEFLKTTYYDLFNAWHQKHFGRIPSYEVSGSGERFYCTLRFQVPENDKGIPWSQRIDVQDSSRSRAREYAARRAYSFLRKCGLWIDLRNAGITPSLDDAINQLQELYQKKYVEAPTYEFEECPGGWVCSCVCAGIDGFGRAANKTGAKKQAAYQVLVRLME